MWRLPPQCVQAPVLVAWNECQIPLDVTNTRLPRSGDHIQRDLALHFRLKTGFQ